jgi:ubiquilin
MGKKDSKKCFSFLPHNLCNRFCYGCSVNVLIIAGPLNNTGLEMLMNMFGGLGAGSLAVPNISNGYYTHLSIFFSSLFFPLWISLFTSAWMILFIFPVPPEELYATQLLQLQEMGFFDTQENIRALIATAGNVHAAVERLLGNSGQ